MRKKKRRFKYLAYKHYDNVKLSGREEHIIELKGYIKNTTHNYNKERYKEIIELYKLIDELDISDFILSIIFSKLKQVSQTNDSVYRPSYWNGGLTKKKPGVRDNKGIYNGGGGSNRNKTRYPSTKRSLKTWKIFYEMFPYYAERDGWNGKTSSRYKGQQKQKKQR